MLSSRDIFHIAIVKLCILEENNHFHQCLVLQYGQHANSVLDVNRPLTLCIYIHALSDNGKIYLIDNCLPKHLEPESLDSKHLQKSPVSLHLDSSDSGAVYVVDRFSTR